MIARNHPRMAFLAGRWLLDAQRPMLVFTPAAVNQAIRQFMESLPS